MKSIDLDETCQNFLRELYSQSGGEVSIQVSMYDIGTVLGMDRQAASRVAEELIGWELADIRTLSGGIGITPNGIQKAQLLIGESSSSEEIGFRFGNDLVLNETGRGAIEKITLDLKHQAGSLDLAFDALNEFIADLKTIDAQLDSPKPKTIILRECFRSLMEAAEKAGAHESAAKIKALIDE
jgi:hypothetical protein